MDQKTSNVSVVDARQRSGSGGIGIRAFVISMICLVIMAYLVPRSQLGGMFIYLDVERAPQALGLGFVFVLLLINYALKRFGVKFGTSEMITVYITCMLGGLILGRGFTSFFVLSSMSLHMLSVTNADIYRGFLGDLSNLIMPKGRQAVQGFWRGGADGVPWGEWLAPMLIWTMFFTLVFFVMLCLLTIVRRQWVDRERLTFPLVIPVLKIVEESSAQEVPFWKNKLIYLGMLFPLLYDGLRLVNFYIPAVPVIPDRLFIFASVASEYPLNVLKDYFISIRPAVIGVGFLLSLELLFSMWFFFFVRLATVVYYNVIGIHNLQYARLYMSQGMGAFAVISLVSLWMSRNEIKLAIAHAFHRPLAKYNNENDDNEPLAYGLAFWGAVVGLIIIVVFNRIFLHVQPVWSVVYFLILFSVSLAFSKIRAETGWPYTHTSPYTITLLMNDTAGGTAMRDNALGLGYYQTMSYGYFGATCAIALESYKFADIVGLRRRALTKFMIFVVFFSILIGYGSSLQMFYDIGANSAQTWYIQQGSGGFHWWAGSETASTLNHIWAAARGGIVTIALTLMRMRYVWWPLHPIGWATAMTPYMDYFWGGFFVAWFIKFFVMRYGGPNMTRKLQPVFLGMIIGVVVVELVASVLGMIIR